MKKLAMLAALGALTLALPLGARAAHCSNNELVIFSYTAGQLAVNTNAGVCALSPDDEIVDSRLINPGSTAISVRFTRDLGAAVPTITGVIDGLGFNNQSITLTRTVNATLGFATYDSDDLTIDPTALDAVTATVTLPSGETSTVCFHTLGASCPDMPV